MDINNEFIATINNNQFFKLGGTFSRQPKAAQRILRRRLWDYQLNQNRMQQRQVAIGRRKVVKKLVTGLGRENPWDQRESSIVSLSDHKKNLEANKRASLSQVNASLNSLKEELEILVRQNTRGEDIDWLNQFFDEYDIYGLMRCLVHSLNIAEEDAGESNREMSQHDVLDILSREDQFALGLKQLTCNLGERGGKDTVALINKFKNLESLTLSSLDYDLGTAGEEVSINNLDLKHLKTLNVYSYMSILSDFSDELIKFLAGLKEVSLELFAEDLNHIKSFIDGLKKEILERGTSSAQGAIDFKLNLSFNDILEGDETAEDLKRYCSDFPAGVVNLAFLSMEEG